MSARPRLDSDTLALLARSTNGGLLRPPGVAIATETAAGNRHRMQELVNAGLARVMTGGRLLATTPGRRVAGVKE